MILRLKRFGAAVVDHRAAISAWLGLALLAQSLSVYTGWPDVIWPAALGIGLLAYSCAETVIDWAMARVVRQPAEGGSK